MRQNEARYRAIFDQSFQFVGLLHPDGTLIESNRSALEFWNLDMSDVAGMPFWETPWWTHSPKQQDRLRDGIRRAATGEFVRFETTHTAPDGTTHDIDFSLRPVCDDAGNVRLVIPEGRDITDLRRAEQQAARFGRVLEHSLNEIYIFDSKTLRFVEVNHGARQNLGYSMDELRELTPLDIKPEHTAESLAKLIEPLCAGNEERIQFTSVHRRKDGTQYPVEIHLQLIGGDDPVFVAIALDISQRRSAEDALRTSEIRSRTLLEGSPICNKIVDLDSRLQYMSAAGREMLKIDDIAPFYGCIYPPDFFPEPTRANLIAHFERAKLGETCSLECQALDTKGAEVWFHTTFVPARDAIGQIENIIVSSVDVTERKRAEAARRELEAQLRQSQKMEAIGQLAGGVAHDFNNLLTAILGTSETLLTTMDEQPLGISDAILKPGLEQIQSAGEQAASLTRQLLAFSRRELTRPEVLVPKTILIDMQGMLQRLIGEHIQLSIASQKASFLICADRGQFEQIIMNLVVNAVDAMPNGGRLEIRLEDVEFDEHYVADNPNATRGRHAVLSVIDNGTGMTPDTCQRMFEPFFTTKPVGKGTGLGLATVYGIVRRLDGHIRVETSPGDGSNITVCIPAAAKASVENEHDQKTASDGAGESILFCEDKRIVREVMSDALRKAGYTVIEADCGEHALRAAADFEGTFNLLISDIVMPGMSGRELANRLTRENPETRVLFVSGYAADHPQAVGVDGTVAELLLKPFGPKALLKRVREVLDFENATR